MITVCLRTSMAKHRFVARVHVLLLAGSALIVWAGTGCTDVQEYTNSARRRLEVAQADVKQQETLLRELEELGADCDWLFWKVSHVNITLGDRWQGGHEGLAILGQLTRVDELVLEGEAVADDAISVGASLPSLSVLRIRNARLTPENAAQLPRAVELHGK